MQIKGFITLLGCLLVSFNTFADAAHAAKKVLYVDSYNEGYAWSDGIAKGIQSVLLSKVITHTPKDQRKNPTGIELKIVHMDTKRNTAEDFKQLAALKVKAEIQTFKPDVVIASDDNASKYLIAPFYKDADMPFVFCGVNWDASVYGFPYKNVTGMIEVDLADQIVESLKTYAKGKRIGIIGADNDTSRKTIENYHRLFGIDAKQIYLSTSFSVWKKDFSRAQDEVDMLILLSQGGINDWNDTEAKAFVESNTKIPTGTPNDWEAPYALLGITKVAEEQGIWAAQTALKILNGTHPSDIPIVANEQSHLILNLRLAEKLDITFKPDLLKLAEIIR